MPKPSIERNVRMPIRSPSMKISHFLLAVCACSSASGQAMDRELLAQVTQHCVAREATTQMMVEGRDKGIPKEQVLEQLPPLTGQSSAVERATFSRLDDVYRMPQIGVKTMAAHRFFGCLWQAVEGQEPKFGSGLEASLVECQGANGSPEAHGACVRAAQRRHVVR
jgi:hypothetical protein